VELGWSWEVEGVVVTGEEVLEVPVARPECDALGPVRTVEDLRDQVTRAFCAAAEDAGSEIPLAHGAAELSVRECFRAADRLVAGWWGQPTMDLDARIGVGAMELDRDMAHACVGSLCSIPATHLILGKVQWPEACTKVFDGLLTAGEECASSLDCADGLACVSAALGCRGTCEELSGQAFACQPACGPGEACYPLPQGPRCLPLGSDGAACRNAAECAPALVCDYGSQRCVSPMQPLAVGQACRPWIDPCEWPNRCVPGEAGGYACGPERAEGKACRARSFDCGAEAFCEAELGSETGLCVARKPGGSACERDRECAGFCAPEGACEDEPRDDGLACDRAAECANGVCASGLCVGGCPT
jgi:hypothetical protein